MTEIDKTEKLVIVINGHGGVGKDTLCDEAGRFFRVKSISSITPVKEIARSFGWNGEKDARSRKFLADLKAAFAAYNDLPLNYLLGEYREFLEGEDEILFVHIREKEEIEKFRAGVREVPVKTVLIRRETAVSRWGNAADDEVEGCDYDYVFQNDRPIGESGRAFAELLREIREKH